MAVASIEDILDIERVPLRERNIPASTYEMLKDGAAIAPDAPALTFFAEAKRYRDATVWSHRELFRRITQAGNLFRRLGVERDDAVAFILPNLPETHLAIWGGEAAGVAFAINPLQNPSRWPRSSKAVEPKLLVTLAPTPGADLFEKATAAAAGLAKLRAVLTVSLAPYAARNCVTLSIRSRKAGKPRSRRRCSTSRRIAEASAATHSTSKPPEGDAISSYFCTGGTTGAPKIARRTHFSEAFDAWAMTTSRKLLRAGKTIFCGLPLFHVNGQLVTGLAPWSKGAHVVMGAPQGYRGEGVIANFWTLVEHFRITCFLASRPSIRRCCRLRSPGATSAASNAAICGAAPMPVQLFQVVSARRPASASSKATA